MATLGVLSWALLLQVLAGLLSLVYAIDPRGHAPQDASEETKYSVESIGGIRGGGKGILWWLYTQIDFDSHWGDVRRFRHPWQPIGLPRNEIDTFRLLFRQSSLLSLAVMGIRFAHGKPILNLF